MSTQSLTPEVPQRRQRRREEPMSAPETASRRTPHTQGLLAIFSALRDQESHGRFGTQLSAFAVMTLSMLTICAWLLSDAAWPLGALIGFAGIALVLGWPALTGIDLPAATLLVLAGTSMILPIVVAASGDLGNAVPILALAAVATLAATIFSAPTPSDHSLPELRAHTSTPVPQHRSHSQATRRPTTLSLASAMSLLVLIGAGSAWSALDVLENWGILVPLTAAIIALVVWGNQIGHSFRAQSFSALGIGILTGITVSISAYWLGRATLLMPIILPEVAQSLGRPVAFMIVGIAAGIAVALAVIVLDGILGDHFTHRPALGALSRGAAKFLIAAIPIYTLVRIGGI